VTNIYEGTSQLQVVAAIGKLLGRTLDPLLDEWCQADYGPELQEQKARLAEATDLFRQASDALKVKARDTIDYYAPDLTGMAAYLVCSWLMLQDATLSEAKRDIAQVYITEHLPQIQAAGQAILWADSLPAEAVERLIG
jgi:hypothetical protein